MDDVSKVAGDGGQQPDKIKIETSAHAINQAPTTKAEKPTIAPDAEQTGDGEQGDSKGDDKAKKVVVKKKDFDIASAQYRNKKGEIVPAANADGLLIAVPKPIKNPDNKEVLYEGWNIKKHAPLKKSHFVSDVVFILFQAFVCRVKAATLLKSAEQKEKRAKHLEQFGDEVQRKKVQKIVKMREAMELLQKQLEDEGVDLSALDDDTNTEN